MPVAIEVLLPPFVACLVLTGIHTYLGLHVVSRGVIFVDLALAQIAALGAIFAFLMGYDPHGTAGYVYSLIFAFVGAGIFSMSRMRERHIPQEAIIGITFAVASASGLLIADRAPQGAEFVEAMLAGALLWVPWPTIWKTALIYTVIGVFHWIYRRRFLALSLEPHRAEAEGWSVRWWDFLFYMSFGFVITSSVAMAGVLLVFSFLVIPSVIAMLFAHRIGARLTIGWIVGTLVSTVGLALSWQYDLPSGPAVVCTFGLALIAAAVGRYLAKADRPVVALARVATGIAAVAGGLWIALATANRPGEGTVSLAAEAEVVAESEPSADSAERAMAALAELEASEGVPPAEVIEELVAAAPTLHQMMTTGEIEVSENAVRALTRAPQDGDVVELLEEIAYHAPDPWARLRGSEGLLAGGSVLGILPLIDLLNSSEAPFLRVQASDLLRQATGQDIPYDPTGSADDQTRAIEAWRAWWEANRIEPLPPS